MAGARGGPPRLDLVPDLFQGLGAVIVDDVDPPLDHGGEPLPCVGEAPVQPFAPPLAEALAHLVGCEEHGRSGLGECAGRPGLLVGDADDHVVHQRVAEVGAQRGGQGLVAGEVGVQGGFGRGELGASSYVSTRS